MTVCYDYYSFVYSPIAHDSIESTNATIYAELRLFFQLLLIRVDEWASLCHL